MVVSSSAGGRVGGSQNRRAGSAGLCLWAHCPTHCPACCYVYQVTWLI
jgi:hypothetical protein